MIFTGDRSTGGYTHRQHTWRTLHPFNGPLSGTTRVSRYQKGKTNRDFTLARDSEWQWHQLGHMQVCTSLQTDNHASTPPLCFLQAGCPCCRPTNSVKALKGQHGGHCRVNNCTTPPSLVSDLRIHRLSRTTIYILNYTPVHH